MQKIVLFVIAFSVSIVCVSENHTYAILQPYVSIIAGGTVNVTALPTNLTKQNLTTEIEQPDLPPPVPEFPKGVTIDLTPQSDKTWVMMDPIQCPEYGTAFWSKIHNNATYPTGQGSNETSIENYYQNHGITIFGLQIASWKNAMVCSACGCPAGNTVYLLVSNSNVNKMERYGYSVALGPVNQGAHATNQTAIANNVTAYIDSIQPQDQSGNPVSAFVKGTNGFAKITISIQSNQSTLTTVDLIGSDLTSLGIGSIKTISNQTNSEMILSFFIPDTAANGTAKICVDVFSDWLDKGGFPLAKESCVPVVIGKSIFAQNANDTHTVFLNEVITINETNLSQTSANEDISCTTSTTNVTQTVELTQENYLDSTVTLKAGQKLFPLYIQKVCTDHIVGIQYFAVPLCCPSQPVVMHIGDSVGGLCTPPKLTLISIQDNKAVFLMNPASAGVGQCPICLSGNTKIDTPAGPMNVKDLEIGMPVWTVDKSGHKQSSIILKTSKIAVPAIHTMVHLVLSDGRELFVSPNHPTTDGKPIIELKIGDVLDRSQVKNIELVQYEESFTYDILPSGPTGFYWADGILVGSTLK